MEQPEEYLVSLDLRSDDCNRRLVEGGTDVREAFRGVSPVPVLRAGFI